MAISTLSLKGLLGASQSSLRKVLSLLLISTLSDHNETPALKYFKDTF